MKIIFLDIDGVLNTYAEQGKHGPNYVDPKKVERVKKIVGATGAKIVISSNWRFDMAAVHKTLSILSQDIIGNTGLTGNRNSEIEEWIGNNDVDSFVVIDDLYLFFPANLVYTKDSVGITDSHVDKAIEILNKENEEKYDDVEKLASLFEKIIKNCIN